MCDLCDRDELKGALAKKGALEMSARLEILALAYKCLSTGKMKPHSDEFSQLAVHAKIVVRELLDLAM